MSKMTDKEVIMSKQYTADDVYKVMQEFIHSIVWNGVRFDIYSFNEDDLWLTNETTELYTTHEKIAQALNNGDTVEFYRLERVEI